MEKMFLMFVEWKMIVVLLCWIEDRNWRVCLLQKFWWLGAWFRNLIKFMSRLYLRARFLKMQAIKLHRITRKAVKRTIRTCSLYKNFLNFCRDWFSVRRYLRHLQTSFITSLQQIFIKIQLSILQYQ